MCILHVWTVQLVYNRCIEYILDIWTAYYMFRMYK